MANESSSPERDPKTAVKRMVARLLRDNFQKHADRLAPLVELGIVDAETVDSLPDNLDFAGALRKFTDRIAAIAENEPSVLKELSIRPIHVLSADSEQEPTESTQDQVPRAVTFSDLEGFTRFTSEKGDVEASALLKDHQIGRAHV